jgi:hypothetical protein
MQVIFIGPVGDSTAPQGVLVQPQLVRFISLYLPLGRSLY